MSRIIRKWTPFHPSFAFVLGVMATIVIIAVTVGERVLIWLLTFVLLLIAFD